MMSNPHRGDVSVVIDGEERCMRLTLGALAALEARLDEPSLAALLERYETGTLRSDDLIALIWAGLNGGGTDIDMERVARAEFAGGALGAARAAGRLLALTFGKTGT